MSELVLVSAQKRPLRPLVEAALTNELCLLEAGIRRTEQRLRDLERKTDDHRGVWPGMKTTSCRKRWTLPSGSANTGCLHGCAKKPTFCAR